MENRATVLESYGDGTALVAVVRTGACAHDCDSCGGCIEKPRTMKLTVRNPIGAQAHDIVIVSGDTKRVLALLSVFFLVPIAFMGLGYLLGAWAQLPERHAVLTAFAGLFIGFAPAFWVNARLQKQKEPMNEITGLVRRPNANTTDGGNPS